MIKYISTITTTLLLFTGSAFAIDYAAIKELNQPIRSDCIDIVGQNYDQSQKSMQYEASLKDYLKAALTETDRTRQITSDIGGVGTDKLSTVFIFRMQSQLSAKAGLAFRFEQRKRLEELIKAWQIKIGDRAQTFLVRFSDECELRPDGRK